MEQKIWVDGVFDLGHFGHANLLRQAKALGDEGSRVIVGIHSDEEVTRHKRAPIFTEQERAKMVGGIKWVDEVVIGAPYITTIETIRAHGCDFCVHGSDITTTETGKDTYEAVKKAGLYKEVPRTQGISTTGLIKRVLNIRPNNSSYTGSNFLPSTRRFEQFSTKEGPNPGDRIIYAPGSFDLVHPGHLDFLREAKKSGDYLIVGLYDDLTVAQLNEGRVYMSLLERALTLYGIKYVDEVIMGCPYEVSEELLEAFKIDLVVAGSHEKFSGEPREDPFLECCEQGKFLKIDSGNSLTTKDIESRILERKEEYAKGIELKEAKEQL